MIFYQLTEQYIDYCTKLSLVCYFWPLYQLGQQDEWFKMGITLNGFKPIC